MADATIILPSAEFYPNNTSGATNQVLNNSAHKIAFVFSARKTMTVNALGTRLGVITGTTPTYRISIQGLNASGEPDGVVSSGSDATFSPSALGWTNGTFNWVSVSGASITRGTLYAIVIEHSSGTIDASNNASFTLNASTTHPANFGLPYHLINTGAWAKQTNSEPVYGYRDATHTFGNPYVALTTTTLATNGHRFALKHAFAAGYGDTFRVRGIMVHAFHSPAAGTYKLGIWDASGTELVSVSHDSDVMSSTAIRLCRGFFAGTLPTLSFGTTYYYGFERVSSHSFQGRAIEVAASADLGAFPFGSGAVLSTWDGSAWTDVPTQVPPMTLYLDDITEPSGGAGPPPFILG
jgi:hypothetical protein